MRFDDLMAKIEDGFQVTIKEEDWHQHPVGNGWVENCATVEESCFIGEDACVMGKSKVEGQVSLRDYACVHDSIIQGNVILRDNCKVIKGSIVSGVIKISDRAVVNKGQVRGVSKLRDYAFVAGIIHHTNMSDDSSIGQYAEVMNANLSGMHTVIEGRWKRSPIYVRFKNYIFYEMGTDLYKYGCQTGNYQYFLDRYGTSNLHYNGSLDKTERQILLSLLKTVHEIQQTYGLG